MRIKRGSLLSLVLRMFGPIMLFEEGDGGGEVWSSSLPDTVKEWDEVTNSDSPEKFWDQMTNMRSSLGQSVRIPSAEAGEDDMKVFHEKLQKHVPGLMPAPDFDNEETMSGLYTKMGRPETPADYVVPEFKDEKDQPIEDLDLSLAEAFKEVAHKSGLSQAKYADIVSSITNVNIATHNAAMEKQREDQDGLDKTWGAASEQNREIVKNFVSKSDAPENVAKALEGNNVDSATMIWLHGLATQTLGKGSDFQNDQNQNGVMTPDEATLKIAEIRNNKEHPYHNKKDPGHKAAMKLIRELYLLKNPVTGKDAAPGTTFRIGGGS